MGMPYRKLNPEVPLYGKCCERGRLEVWEWEGILNFRCNVCLLIAGIVEKKHVKIQKWKVK